MRPDASPLVSLRTSWADAGLMLGSCCGPMTQDIHMTPRSTDSRPGTDTGPDSTGAHLQSSAVPMKAALCASPMHHHLKQGKGSSGSDLLSCLCGSSSLSPVLLQCCVTSKVWRRPGSSSRSCQWEAYILSRVQHEAAQRGSRWRASFIVGSYCDLPCLQGVVQAEDLEARQYSVGRPGEDQRSRRSRLQGFWGAQAHSAIGSLW